MLLHFFKKTDQINNDVFKNYSEKFFLEKNKKRIKGILSDFNTPVFIGDQKLILNKYKKLKNSLNKIWGKKNLIAFSYKTNYEVANENFLKDYGAWAEVVSEKEYQLAKKNGYKNEIVYNGPYKSNDSMRQALKDGSLINLDNFSDLNKLIKLSGHINEKSNIGIRLKVFAKGSRKSRFGFSIYGKNNEAQKAIDILLDNNISINGVHIHLGSDIINPCLYRYAAREVAGFLNKNKIKDLKYLDFGGGFPSNALKPFFAIRWRIFSIDSYVKEITMGLSELKNKEKVILILEPGRYLVDDSIIKVSKVIDVKNESSSQIITADSTIAMLPLAYYRPQMIGVYDENLTKANHGKIKTKIFGSTCKEDDVLFDGYLSIAKFDYYLIYYCVGAYNSSMSSDFIFHKPLTKWL